MIRGVGWVQMALLTAAVARSAAAVWAAVWSIRGDYYASLPGAYVRTVNPTLWNSSDLQQAWGYQLNTYFHGPVQYLTLYPVAYFDSYAAIAQFLLPIYAMVLGAGFWLLRGAANALTSRRPLTVPLLASTFLFFPLLQAFIQREFEVIVFLALAASLWLLVHDRRQSAAAALAYITWFKYVPLLFVGYLGLRRWFKELGVFAVVSVVILTAAQLLFGLDLFVNNNVPGHAAQVFNLWNYGFERRVGHEFWFGTGFCYGWIESETTLANVRHALCALAFRAPWLPPHWIYLAICMAIAAVYLAVHHRLERGRPLPTDRERWRRAIELSIVTTVCACFFFNHYYYLIVLIIPLNVLLARYLTDGRRPRLALWGIAYFLLSAFVVPTSVLSQLTGVDVWALYIKGAFFLWGELLLVYLLLREYGDVTDGPRRHRVAEIF